ncbi:MAG: ABC-F family ATP-binding cassette domain-containing protein [Nitriliruptoraceae bacterium]
MHLVSVTGLGAEVDGRWLFSDASFGLRLGDRVGVVGPNGVGKTTLLRILAGDRTPEAGEVVMRRATRVAWLPQEAMWPDGKAVDIVTAGGNDVDIVEVHQAEAILSRLGIDAEQPTDRMSGGERRRVALARVLVTPSELLILDEPTNHLDVDTVDWLEQELARRQAAIVMVTHDRYLLERVVNRMLDLDPAADGGSAPPRRHGARVTWHEGNYSSLLEHRARRAELDQHAAARARNLLTKEVAWLRRQPKARTSKPKFRTEQVAALREAARNEPEAATLDLGTGRRRLGNDVCALKDIVVQRGETRVLDAVDLVIGPGERVGVVGPNGAGKTTLLEVIIGALPPDEGTVRIGSTVHVGYYPQLATAVANNVSVIDTLLAIAAHIPLANGDTLPAARLAERFGFSAALQRTAVADLSGGERRRLALLHVLVDAPNVLVLDEPTNDLDLDTLAVLDDHLDGFAGTLIVASHDRFVLDRLTDRTIAVGDGRVTEHLDHDAYRRAQSKAAKATTAPAHRMLSDDRPITSTSEAGTPTDASARRSIRAAAKASSPSGQPVANRQRQQARKDRRRAEERIERLEAERDTIYAEMAEAAHDPARLSELQENLAQVLSRLDMAEAEWLVAAEAEELE